MQNNIKTNRRLPFLGAWELNKAVMLLLGGVVVAVMSSLSGISFLTAKQIAWTVQDLSGLSLFSSALSVFLFWTMAHRIEFIQKNCGGKSAQILAGAFAALFVILGALEILAYRHAGILDIFVTMKYTAFALISVLTFGWAMANRLKPVIEIRHAISCVMLGILFYTASRFMESFALFSFQGSLLFQLAAISFQLIGLVLGFTGIVIYERFLYTLNQYKISRHFFTVSGDENESMLEWAMKSIGTPVGLDKVAHTPSGNEVHTPVSGR